VAAKSIKIKIIKSLDMAKQLKKWQGWLLFGGAMVIVFVLGLTLFVASGAKGGGSQCVQ
jgi:hypothetical protein